MKEPLQHPLDSLYPNHSLLLLEALIPYVDPSLKLPLALLIKMQEIRTLCQVFQNPVRMEACGMNRRGEPPEQMLSVLCQSMGFDLYGQLRQAQAMMDMMNPMNAMSQPGGEPPPEPEESPAFTGSARDDLITAIRQILSEEEVFSNESESAT